MMALAVLAGIYLGGGLSERWIGQTLAAPETTQPKAPPTSLALLDVAYIFKNHKVFDDQMKDLAQKALAFQQTMKATEAQLQLLKSRMEQVTDKAEKEKLEADLAKQVAEFQLLVRTNQRDFQEVEAKIYYETYLMLQEETKKYCRARGIHVVLKTIREPIKADDRNSVMQGLARPIIFSDAPDISDDLLKALDAAAETKAAKPKAN
ncbi:MAG: OmpH family outer membrane protein [Pirellulaceae bacterium]